MQPMIEARPVGIGPVIAGQVAGAPVYYVDVAYQDGRVERLTWRKSTRRACRTAKLAAIRERIALAKQLRPAGVVLAHDQESFTSLVRLLGSLAAGMRKWDAGPVECVAQREDFGAQRVNLLLGRAPRAPLGLQVGA